MKFKEINGWACISNRGQVFVTAQSPHESTIGRFEIYETRLDALRNALRPELVVKVRIKKWGKK